MSFLSRGLSVCKTLVRFSSKNIIMAQAFESGVFSAAFITCPNLETAKALARGMVEQNLAACVNVIPNITSIYTWENKLEEDSEVLLMVKTRSTRVPDISDYIKKNHPYDVPEVISLKIDQGMPSYLDFLDKKTVEKTTE
ncbi:protein CutA homolog [Actinia tenebrosa]|uniref:Protein CutA homolog n=1 Tax=Actinia tenebrosa TaxID=6105 RepID=A0A6P8I2X6_ACTTE|nr:protein CutA homolog [Actinia tenebrosa]